MSITTDELIWRRHNGTPSLHHGRDPDPLLYVVPDSTYPNMWRIRHPDGSLSDMVNLSRVKDAALTIAVGRLNQKQHRPGAAGAPPVRSQEGARGAKLSLEAPARMPPPNGGGSTGY